MPLTRQQKEGLIATYGGELAAAPHVFLVDFTGLSVPQATELRSRLRAEGASYMVVKNRLARRAAEGGALAGLEAHFRGPTAAAYSDGDPVALAKVLTEFAKEAPTLGFKAGLVDGREVAAEEIREIASLPGRQELVAKLLFLLQSPIVRLARTLAELPRGFVSVLHQIGEKKGRTEEAGG